MEKVSVITVVRNGEDHIKATVESVLGQTTPPYEYVIWDGLSTDRTIEVVSRFDSPLIKLVSKMDSGPYDAMNQAVKMCTGDWVIFMNCGDEFSGDNVLSEMMQHLKQDYGVVYGGCTKVFPFGERIQSPGHVGNLWKSTIFWHQSAFINRSLQARYPFDCRYRVCADYDFTWKVFLDGEKFLRVENVISRVISGGISDVHEFRGIVERYLVTRDARLLSSTFMFLIHVLSFVIRVAAKKCLPKALVERIRLSRKVSA